MAGSVAMKLAGLSVGYTLGREKKVLLGDINVEIRRGEIVCLLGQNGVGKSSLLRTISGIQPPLSGNIFLNERSLADFSVQEIAHRISVVLTEKIATGNLSAFELVALGRYPYTNWLGILTPHDKEKVEEAISLTKINYLSDKRIGELSDGQYQKSMIARALAQDGELMILDEPTAFLDLNNSVEIFLLLSRLAREQNKAIVVSTHDFHLAMQFADRLWLTNFNSPLFDGLPEDLGLNGQLEQSMFHEGFGLDLLSGRIILSVKERGTISLQGHTTAHEWTRRALERKGYIVSAAGSTHLELKEKDGKTYWSLDAQQFFSISELLTHLEKTED